MSSNLSKLIKQTRALTTQAKQIQASRQKTIPSDIVAYAKSKGIQLTADQKRVLNQVLTNQPVICHAAHSVGKSLMSALLACWYFETHPHAIGLVTAPVNRQISEIIFKEMRRIMPNNPYFAPKANSLYRSHDWWLNGYATSSGDAFQGKHSPGGILIIFDEASGVDNVFWERAQTMFEAGKKNHYFLAIGNPYSVSSPMYLNEQTGRFQLETISALNHPNIVQKKEIVPGAITYETVIERIKSECRVAHEHEKYRAFEFENQFYISENPLFDVQILGEYPQQADFSLWSEQDIRNLQEPMPDSPKYQVAIGCDVARHGSARTVIFVRRGPNLIHCEAYKGYRIDQTAAKLKEVANNFCPKGFNSTKIPIFIDGTGLGAGVCDLAGTAAGKYNFIEVNNSSKPTEQNVDYVNNKRSELWIKFRDLARNKQISIGMLHKKLQIDLIKELRMPEFSIDNKGRTVLESKDKISKRLGMSPDLADAAALAYHVPSKHFESHF